jgi:hypothetical protein
MNLRDYESDVYTGRVRGYHPIVVWQFWGRAARRPELRFRALFIAVNSGQ